MILKFTPLKQFNHGYKVNLEDFVRHITTHHFVAPDPGAAKGKFVGQDYYVLITNSTYEVVEPFLTDFVNTMNEYGHPVKVVMDSENHDDLWDKIQ